MRVEPGRIGVIKLHSLESGQSAVVRSRIQELQKQGVEKLIFDLRGVANGTLEEAVAVTNLFISEGELAKVLGRDNKVIQTFTADSSKAIFSGKVVALIDFATAGAAEVVASAILDRKRGEVVGERSFGAGTQQQLFSLRSGDGLLLTTAKWASPAGTPFLGDDRASMGVKPSVEVKRPDRPEPVGVEELIEQQDPENREPSPGAVPQRTPKVEEPKAVPQDVQLQKAIEILDGKAESTKAAGR
jgi:carboxyl-terminal processing protease